MKFATNPFRPFDENQFPDPSEGPSQTAARHPLAEMLDRRLEAEGAVIDSALVDWLTDEVERITDRDELRAALTSICAVADSLRRAGLGAAPLLAVVQRRLERLDDDGSGAPLRSVLEAGRVG